MNQIPAPEEAAKLLAKFGITFKPPLTRREIQMLTEHKPNGIQANRKGKPGPKTQ